MLTGDFSLEMKSFVEQEDCVIFSIEHTKNIKTNKTRKKDIFRYDRYNYIPHTVSFEIDNLRYRGCMIFFESFCANHLEIDGVPSTDEVDDEKLKKINYDRKSFCENYHDDDTWRGILILPKFVSRSQYIELKKLYAKIKLKAK